MLLIRGGLIWALLTDFAVKANDAEELSGTALGVAEEAGRASGATAAVLERLGNGSGGKESGDGEELHFEDESKNEAGSKCWLDWKVDWSCSGWSWC